MLNMILLFSLSAFSASESANTFEKTYPRDNTFCSFKDTRVEFLIRGSNKFTEPKEMGYGEFIFSKKSDKKPQLLTLNEFRADTLRFFTGTSSLCSKSHGYMVGPSTMAILLLKENRPFTDKLVIQLFDFKTVSAIEHIETNYPTDRARKTDNGFIFRTVGELSNPDIGKITIGGETFIYQEKDFPIWINYTVKGFEVSADETFNKFPWKKAFKTKEDFFARLGWEPTTKKFNKGLVFLAVNHKQKKKCLLFLETKSKLTGNEVWLCQDM